MKDHLIRKPSIRYFESETNFLLIDVLRFAIQLFKMNTGEISMANKTANVMARVSPDVKTQAESILEQIGIPVSVVINALYKQIILTKSIPFSLSIPQEPITLNQMDQEAFDAMLEKGYQEAIGGKTVPAAEAFYDIKKKL